MDTQQKTDMVLRAGFTRDDILKFSLANLFKSLTTPATR
jgi:hypothetical protein